MPKRKLDPKDADKGQKRQKPLCPLRKAIVQGNVKLVCKLAEERVTEENIIELLRLALGFGHEHVYLAIMNEFLSFNSLGEETWKDIIPLAFNFDSVIVYEDLRSRGVLGKTASTEFVDLMLDDGAMKLIEHTKPELTIDIECLSQTFLIEDICRLDELGFVHADPSSVIGALSNLIDKRDIRGVEWILQRFGNMIDKKEQAGPLIDLLLPMDNSTALSEIIKLLHHYDVLVVVDPEDNVIFDGFHRFPFLRTLPEVQEAAIQGPTH